MRVLITGGSGFIGKRIAARLAARGDDVIVFDPVVSPDLAGMPNVKVIEGDVTRMAQVAEAFAGGGIDAVVHCAAIVGVLASIENPRRVMEVNVQGSLNVLEAMRTFGVTRLVHISSIEVYGDARTPVVHEGHPLQPQLPYGISKVAIEQLGRTYRSLHGLECINLRGSWIYASDLPRPRLPNLLIARLQRGEAVHIAQGADSVMDYVHADDFAAAVLATLARPVHAHDAYNIGSGIGTSLAQLVDLVRDLMPGAEISVGPGRYEFRPGLPMRVQGALDIARAREELNYEPKFDLRRGIQDLIQAGRDRDVERWN